jgi:hypothetical protein
MRDDVGGDFTGPGVFLATVKAFLEHGIRLNLTLDRYPKDIQDSPYL